MQDHDGHYSIEDLETLDGLTEVVLPRNEAWMLVADQHDVCERFETGPNGMTFGELTGVVARVYARLARTRPTIKWEDDDLGKGECPFWGDHCFPEQFDVDSKTRTVSIHFGS